MRTVFTNGCFEILHAGHVNLLQRAAALGDRLVVGLNSDVAVCVLKGDGHPIQSEQNRLSSLLAIRWVDDVRIVNSTDMCHILDELKPTIWAKGGDYNLGTLNPAEVEVAKRNGTKIVILPIEIDVHTSSLLGL